MKGLKYSMFSSKWYRWTAAGFIILGICLAMVYWITGLYMYFTNQVTWLDVVTFDTAVGGKWAYPTPYTLIFASVHFTALSAISILTGCVMLLPALKYIENRNAKHKKTLA